jgi:hypothetical protein
MANTGGTLRVYARYISSATKWFNPLRKEEKKR